MFDNPGFDPKKFSDEELLNRSFDLSTKLSWAATYGSGYPIHTIQQMLQMITNEQRERAFIVGWNKNKAYINRTIETDPDLQNTSRQDEPVVDKLKPRPRIARHKIPIATKVPVNPTENLIEDDDTNE